MSLNFVKPERISLKQHPEFSEKWVQQRIIEDPTLLGLGEVVLIAAEKIQPKAGRLDLLLHDEQLNRRYEVELMLGATDPKVEGANQTYADWHSAQLPDGAGADLEVPGCQ